MPKEDYNFTGLDEIKKQYDFTGLESPEEAVPAGPKTVDSVLLDKLSGGGSNLLDKLKTGAEYVGETAQDYGMGALQDITLGGADELSGLGQAAAAKVTGTDQGRSFEDLYREYQQLSEKGFDESKTRSPYAYGAGELTGGVALGALTAGSGLLLGAGGQTLKQVGKTAAKEALAQGLGKEVAKGAAKSAVRGELIETGLKTAPIGALAGALSSKGNLDTEEGRQMMLADALGAGTVGAIAGPALRGTVETIAPKISKMLGNMKEWAGEFTEDRDLLRQLKKSYKMGQEGTRISEGQAYSGKVVPEQQLADIREVTNKFLDADKKLGNQFGEVLNNASKIGTRITVDDNTIQIAKGFKELIDADNLLIGPAQSKKLSYELNNLIKNNVNGLDPKNLFNIRSSLAEIGNSVDNPRMANLVRGLQTNLKGELESNIPELKALSKQFKEFRQSGPETVISGGQPVELEDVWFGDLHKKQATLSNDVRELLAGLTTPGQQKAKAARTFSQLINNLENFDKANPGKLKDLGFEDIGDFKKKLLEKADRWAIDRQVLGYEPQSSWLTQLFSTMLGSGSTTARGIQLDVMNRLGTVSNKLGNKNYASTMANKLYNAPNNALKGLSEELQELPGLKYLGDALAKGLENNSATNKNAALFAIMQNPKARLLIDARDLENENE